MSAQQLCLEIDNALSPYSDDDLLDVGVSRSVGFRDGHADVAYHETTVMETDTLTDVTATEHLVTPSEVKARLIEAGIVTTATPAE